MSTITTGEIVLEPDAQGFADAVADPPFLSDLPPDKGRSLLDDVQSGDVTRPAVEITDIDVAGGPAGRVSVRIVRPPNAPSDLPVVLYLHGGGWVLGSTVTHDRLIRELAVGVPAAVVFPSYSLSPEAPYPTAIEQIYDGGAVDRGAGVRQRLRLLADRDRRRQCRRQHGYRRQPDGQGARRTDVRAPTALLPRDERGVRHAVVRAVRRGIPSPPRRYAMVLGPVHDRPGAACGDHRVAPASNVRRPRRAAAGHRDHCGGRRAPRRR